MITIYGKNNCGWCLKAKKYCENNDIEHEYIIIETKEQAIKIGTKFNMNSVPIIVDNNILIGGWSDFIYQLNTNL